MSKQKKAARLIVDEFRTWNERWDRYRIGLEKLAPPDADEFSEYLSKKYSINFKRGTIVPDAIGMEEKIEAFIKLGFSIKGEYLDIGNINEKAFMRIPISNAVSYYESTYHYACKFIKKHTL